MVIQSSNIGMSSKRSYEAVGSTYSSLATWGPMKNTQATLLSGTYVKEHSENGSFMGSGNFSDSMEHVLDKFKEAQSISSARVDASVSGIKSMHQQIFDHLLYWLFGGKMPSADASELASSNGFTQQEGGIYDYESYYSESESTAFSTTGTVVTADGRSIDFNMSVYMSRSFTQYASEHLEFGAPRMTDPLVINLDSNVASVSDQKFYFDLDADGHEEYISKLNPGSGYLALDKNHDGIINDGSELFGTGSGDGFGDLAQYDDDKNGWIDENDAIFDELLIWRQDENGKDSLCGIGAAGIGALYLGSADTQFSLNSAHSNAVNARIQKTGMFLYENGNVGTMQHVDMAQ